jgi:hypothetical protein
MPGPRTERDVAPLQRPFLCRPRDRMPVRTTFRAVVQQARPDGINPTVGLSTYGFSVVLRSVFVSKQRLSDERRRSGLGKCHN